MLVAFRPQTLTIFLPRYATNGKRNAVRTGFARALSIEAEWK